MNRHCAMSRAILHLLSSLYLYCAMMYRRAQPWLDTSLYHCITTCSLHHIVTAGTGVYPASCPVATWPNFPGVTAPEKQEPIYLAPRVRWQNYLHTWQCVKQWCLTIESKAVNTFTVGVNTKKTDSVRDVTMRRVPATIVAAEKQ
jgi:hypothetical protein